MYAHHLTLPSRNKLIIHAKMQHLHFHHSNLESKISPNVNNLHHTTIMANATHCANNGLLIDITQHVSSRRHCPQTSLRQSKYFILFSRGRKASIVIAIVRGKLVMSLNLFNIQESEEQQKRKKKQNTSYTSWQIDCRNHITNRLYNRNIKIAQVEVNCIHVE